jgi:hypothetical protein
MVRPCGRIPARIRAGVVNASGSWRGRKVGEKMETFIGIQLCFILLALVWVIAPELKRIADALERKDKP